MWKLVIGVGIRREHKRKPSQKGAAYGADDVWLCLFDAPAVGTSWHSDIAVICLCAGQYHTTTKRRNSAGFLLVGGTILANNVEKHLRFILGRHPI